ncbi:glycosyltransferase [Elizabethkingia meningoseptica]|uniref:glycosyltransferase n=1 Tax=Elizabethkingia meningoseptica TaxID=238 RepID=UPI0023AE7ABB|nr:glycosyltransferase [Elizabethkingia meningoseptica]MDE5493016.1 glycosyltransferase [Elizabethkingia meningoseptica]
MKNKFSIVYFGDVYDVNGVNFVTNLFVQGKDIFSSNELSFEGIFCKNGLIDIKETYSLAIGKHINDKSYHWKRRVRMILSKIISSSNAKNAWFKINNSMINPAKSVIDHNISNLNQNDILVFQDIFTAYFYHIHPKRNEKVKTVLILHCDKEPFGQLLSYYPSIIETKYNVFLDQVKKEVYEKISKVVFLSKKTLDYNIDIIEKASYIYNGISDLETIIDDSDEFFNIVCLGSIVGHKGQELVLKALKQMPNHILNNIRLHLIGEGPKEKELKSFVEKEKLSHNVIFYGVRNDVDILLRKMDLMILASKSEGMPISIIEGMRQGMFILATKVGGIEEMIKPAYGSFIERDLADIMGKIKSVFYQSNKSYKKCARKAFLENFTIEEMSNKYSQLFLELLDVK